MAGATCKSKSMKDELGKYGNKKGVLYAMMHSGKIGGGNKWQGMKKKHSKYAGMLGKAK